MGHFRHAWRNLWRNRNRTAITLAAIALNTAILIATYALMGGLMKQAVSYATDLVIGEAQIHGPGYRKDRSLYKTVPDPAAIEERARSLGIGATLRSYCYGLTSTGTKSAGALLWGIDPARERKVFDLADHLLEGSFLADRPERGIVLGRKLARSLHASIGSEVIVILQAADGSLGNEIYRVTGILKAAGEGFDRSTALLHIDDFREIVVLPDGVHEIALNTRGALGPEEIGSALAPVLDRVDFRTWREILPVLSDMVNISGVAIGIFSLIFLFAGALGVMNTMLMAIFERFREFGVLKAIGASPLRIIRSVAAETFLLVILATLSGAAAGLAGAWYLKEVGIDTSRVAPALSAAGVAFDPVWRAIITVPEVVGPVVAMWIACLLGALYPATIAARLDPVRAIEDN